MVFSPFPYYHDPNSNWQQQLVQPSLQDGSSSTHHSGGPTGEPRPVNRPMSMAELARTENIPRPAPVNCPRPMCGSHNTKFCYYNNRSFAQPRFWCRNCRRHWTHGGSIRSIPSGGNRRGTRRPRTSNFGRPTATSEATPLALGMENYHEGNRFDQTLAARFPFELEMEPIPSFDVGDVDGGFGGLNENLGFGEFGNPNY